MYFIRHNLKPGDIVNLSDSDSEIIISQKLHRAEDIIKVSNYHSEFFAQIVFMDKATVEVEIKQKIRDVTAEDTSSKLTLIQSITNDSKFAYLLEKSVEIGIDKIIPVESEYSLITQEKALKKADFWQHFIDDAADQSRTPKATILDKTINLKELCEETIKTIKPSNRICLYTESAEENSMTKFFQNCDKSSDFIVAIGPEKGWSSKDIEKFKSLKFRFLLIKGNILRTETAGIFIGAIVNFITGKYN